MNTMSTGDFRCGRRKQANPRKKNADEEGNTQDEQMKLSKDHDDSGEEMDSDPASPQKDLVFPSDMDALVTDENGGSGKVSQEESKAGSSAGSDDEQNHIDTAEDEQHSSVLQDLDPDTDEQGTAPVDYGDEFMLRCNFCSKGFQRMAQLRQHSQEEHGEDISPYQCNKCGASYAVKSQLEKHMAFHSPTSQVCKVCHKTFANVYRLQRHMLSHSENSDLRKFKCSECGKAFKFKHHLKEHIRIHSGEKPFSCSNCGKRFSHSGSYSSHMTSKKCWVVSMKVRSGQNQSTPEDLRTLAPKMEQNQVDPNMYAYQLAMSHYMGFDQHQLLSGVNGVRPQFLPFPRFSGVPNSLVPNLSIPNQPFQFPKSQNSINSENLEVLSKVAAQQALLPEKSKTDQPADNSESPPLDLNQNKKSGSKEDDDNENTVDGSSHILMRDIKQETEESNDASSTTSSSDLTDSSGNEQKDELSSVRKILAVVEATVAQQRSNQIDKTKLSKLVTRNIHTNKSNKNSNNTPMTLANRARQVIKHHLKHTNVNGNLSKSDSDEESDVDSKDEMTGAVYKCKFCSQLFKSPVEQHQHERYLCKYNDDIPKKPLIVPSVSRPGSMMNKDKNGLHWDPFCKHCNAKFDSPVELHQHERYICSKNRDIQGLVKTEPTNKESPQPKNNTHQFSDVNDYRAEQRIRSRSNINEEQLQILKSHYKQNPRPTREELQMLALKLGFPKRVVQVWFQNRRAQEKRVGRAHTSYHDNLPTTALAWEKSTKNGAAYIPVVPQFQPSCSSQSIPAVASQQPLEKSLESNGTICDEDQNQPLDLSTRKSPKLDSPEDTTYNIPQVETPHTEENGVLNLSKKKVGEQNSDFEDTAIFKYMQQECVFPNDGKNAHIQYTPTSIMDMNSQTIQSHSSLEKPLHIEPKPAPTSTHMSSPGSYLSAGSPSSSELTSPHSSLESSFNSTVSLDSAGLDQRAKRARKKSWRQVEAEESQLELDEENVDDDFHHRKKRKCWKQHKVESDEGMYGCDQCDKLFSKQSSLARHKYEHSGQRPFNCEICCKAFKHKHHLTEHKRLHSGEKPFMCQKCGKKFSHSGSFSQHMNHRYKYCKPLHIDDSY